MKLYAHVANKSENNLTEKICIVGSDVKTIKTKQFLRYC